MTAKSPPLPARPRAERPDPLPPAALPGGV